MMLTWSCHASQVLSSLAHSEVLARGHKYLKTPGSRSAHSDDLDIRSKDQAAQTVLYLDITIILSPPNFSCHSLRLAPPYLALKTTLLFWTGFLTHWAPEQAIQEGYDNVESVTSDDPYNDRAASDSMGIIIGGKCRC